jgi:hypothetical protein
MWLGKLEDTGHEIAVIRGSEKVEVMLMMEGCRELGMQLIM